MSNIKNRNIGILVSETKGLTHWIGMQNEQAVSSATQWLDTLATKLEHEGLTLATKLTKEGLTVRDANLDSVEAACETGTCFYDSFRFNLGNQSTVHISLDGRKILYAQPVETDVTETNDRQILQETIDQAVLSGFRDLLKLFNVKQDPFKELSYLPHPLNLSAHYYDSICIFPDCDEPFSRAVHTTLHSLGFMHMGDGSGTLPLFGHGSVRLYQQGDVRHIRHLHECLKKGIIDETPFNDIVAQFEDPHFSRVHPLYYSR